MDKKYVVMISGANRGIGRAIAKCLYASTNYYLSLGVRSPDDFNESTLLADQHRVLLSAYDAQKAEEAEPWVNATLAQFGQINGLVNNAGIWRDCNIENYNESALDEMWLVNTKAPIKLTSLVWPELKKTLNSRIVNIVSIAGKLTQPDEFGYHLTKHAMLAFTHAIRQSGWEHGIRVAAVCPGWVNTEMATESGMCSLSGDEMVQPEDIAQMVKMLIELPNTASIAEITVNPQCGQLF